MNRKLLLIDKALDMCGRGSVVESAKMLDLLLDVRLLLMEDEAWQAHLDKIEEEARL